MSRHQFIYKKSLLKFDETTTHHYTKNRFGNTYHHFYPLYTNKMTNLKRLFLLWVVIWVCAFISPSHWYEPIQPTTYSYEASRVNSIRTHIGDLHMLKEMGYSVDMIEVYSLFRDLDTACINYMGIDYRIMECINRARLEVQGF